MRNLSKEEKGRGTYTVTKKVGGCYLFEKIEREADR